MGLTELSKLFWDNRMVDVMISHKCKICSSTDIRVEYHGKLRTGVVATQPCQTSMTSNNLDVFICGNCGVMWHNHAKPPQMYESGEYWEILTGEDNADGYYKLYDKKVLDKLTWTGTDIFRNKVVADVGTGGGSFLDFLSGVAKRTIAIEPAKEYRRTLESKGHCVFDYVSTALSCNDSAAEGGALRCNHLI